MGTQGMASNHDQIKNDPRWKAARKHTLSRDGHRCVACGAEDDLTVDHIEALDTLLKTGGDPFDEDNLRTLCRPCNSRKGKRDLLRVGWTDPAWSSVVGSLTHGRKTPPAS